MPGYKPFSAVCQSAPQPFAGDANDYPILQKRELRRERQLPRVPQTSQVLGLGRGHWLLASPLCYLS